jgi:SAM-dependent methyltransferase
MLAEAREQRPDIEFIQSCAESTPFASAAFSLINVSMAIHWMDHNRFVNEAKRLLEPSGFLSIDNYGFTGKMLPDNGFNEFNEGYWLAHFPPARRGDNYPDEALFVANGFERVAEIPYDHQVSLSLTGFVGYLRTQSNVQIKGHENLDEIEAQLRSVYASFFNDSESIFLFAGMLKLYRKIP